MTYLLTYVSAFANTKPDPTHLYDEISLGVDTVLCHDQDTILHMNVIEQKRHMTLIYRFRISTSQSFKN